MTSTGNWLGQWLPTKSSDAKVTYIVSSNFKTTPKIHVDDINARPSLHRNDQNLKINLCSSNQFEKMNLVFQQ